MHPADIPEDFAVSCGSCVVTCASAAVRGLYLECAGQACRAAEPRLREKPHG